MVDLGYDAGAPSPRPEAVRTWKSLLAEAHLGLSDAERIDMIRGLEELKCAAEAAQAVIAADFDESQRSNAAKADEPADRRGRGIAAQVALARRESPHRGQQHLGLAKVLRAELPCTMAAFRAGTISEWKAMIVARETACLSLEHRMTIDEQVAGDATRVEALGNRELAEHVRQRAYELDPRSFVERRRRAESERRTSVRPAPDVMAYFTALLPVQDAVKVQAALHHAAVAMNLAGDPRSHGQLMTDILVERVVSPHAVDSGPGVPLMINVVVPDSVLLGDADGAGWLEGYGTVPGDLIRDWIAENCEGGVDTWTRRLYERPATGDLVAMDSKARLFAGRLAEFLRLRDRGCRTPYCDAPVKHLDHSVKKAHGGPTDAAHGQGLCEACNYNKEAIGWSAQPRPGPRHTVETVTPTGHRYTSTAPKLGPRRTPGLFYPGVYPVAA